MKNILTNRSNGQVESCANIQCPRCIGFGRIVFSEEECYLCRGHGRLWWSESGWTRPLWGRINRDEQLY